MAPASTSDLERAKRVYGDLVRTVLDLATECPESRHVVALAVIVDAFHDHILRPLETGRRGGRLIGRARRPTGDPTLH